MTIVNSYKVNKTWLNRLYEQALCSSCYKEKNDMETFKDIINGDKPVLVDFHATWCGPCKVMSPTIESVGKELKGQARVLKIDVDKNNAVANLYRIQSVPTLIIFKKGEAVWRNSGVMEKSTLLEQIKQFID